MEKRVLFAALLSFLVVMTWTWLNPIPEPVRPAVEPKPAAETAGATSAPTPERAETAEVPPVPATPTEAIAAASEERLTVTSGVFEVLLTNRGGRALSWKLLGYKSSDGQPLELIPQLEDEQEFLRLEVAEPTLDEVLASALYRVERERTADPPGERVTFVWSDGSGLEVSKTLRFEDTRYLVGVDATVRDRGRDLAPRLVLGPGFAAQEASGNYAYESLVWSEFGRVTHHQRSKKHGFAPLREQIDETAGLPKRAMWAGLEDQYFAVLVLPGENGAGVGFRTEKLARPVPGGEEVEPIEEGIVSVSLSAADNQLFVGPKDYHLLARQGRGLEQVVWFFSNGFLNWISRQIYFGLVWIHDHTVPNYGLAIILATFVLRILLFPVNQYSMVSMKKTQIQMQRLQPKIKALRNKYKKSKDADSRTKMNQEMMELYRQEGVNPMGGLNGCLPMLAQVPILIGFYGMLTVAIELRGAPFVGWIRDLSRHDPAYVLPILMGVTMFLQQRMAMTKVTDPVQLQQQRIMLFMPIVFTGICLQLPSGLVLYWFVSNVLGMGQQWLVNRHTARLEQASQGA
jgi:YidC/Oxa1 family membrane protein insertase